MKRNDLRNKQTGHRKICACIQKDKFLGKQEPEYVTVLKITVEYTMYRASFLSALITDMRKCSKRGYVPKSQRRAKQRKT
jgi:hypothetical protein